MSRHMGLTGFCLGKGVSASTRGRTWLSSSCPKTSRTLVRDKAQYHSVRCTDRNGIAWDTRSCIMIGGDSSDKGSVRDVAVTVLVLPVARIYFQFRSENTGIQIL